MQANILKVVYISIISMLFQAISNTELGILSQFTSQNGNQWAGPLSISMIFLGSGIGSLYNRYINQYRYRYILFIGSLGWTLFIGLIVLFLHIGFSTVVEVCLIIGSFVSGLLVSVFYNSIFNYVNECTRQDKQQSKYFGINMSLTQTSNIVGNVASALLIAPLTQNVYAIVMNVVIFLISLGFIPVKNITKL